MTRINTRNLWNFLQRNGRTNRGARERESAATLVGELRWIQKPMQSIELRLTGCTSDFWKRKEGELLLLLERSDSPNKLELSKEVLVPKCTARMDDAAAAIAAPFSAKTANAPKNNSAVTRSTEAKRRWSSFFFCFYRDDDDRVSMELMPGRKILFLFRRRIESLARRQCGFGGTFLDVCAPFKLGNVLWRFVLVLKVFFSLLGRFYQPVLNIVK